jgi:rhamnulokinase
VPVYAAIDLGATSGRVVNVRVDRDGIELDLVRRFPTTAVAGPDRDLTWDIDGLLSEVRSGLVDACRRAPVTSVAVDGWGVDYGLLDAAGALVGDVHAYRSGRTDGVMAEVTARLGQPWLYGITGIQFLPFNTLYQLVAARDTADYRTAARLLMVPDLVNHVLCGSTTNDVTNASTTQLLDAATRTWSPEIVRAAGLRPDLMPELHEPGAVLGRVRGLDPIVDGLPVVAAASHDTASAVAGTPLPAEGGGAYISCGTWSLVGREVATAVTTTTALGANVTNELGVGGSIRLLKNVTGLWLLEECRRAWAAGGRSTTSADLFAGAAATPGGRSVIDPDDPHFASPGDMPARIAARCRASGQPVPASPEEIVRVIVDSLATAWRLTLGTIERISGTPTTSLHLVGGGSAVPLLLQLCASACERPVVAGPVEATVIGNALVQAVTDGVLDDVAEGRALVERTVGVERVTPAPALAWDEMASRLLAARSSA